MIARCELFLLFAMLVGVGQVPTLKSGSFAQAETMARVGDESSLQAFYLDQSGEHVFRFRPTQGGQRTLLLNLEGSSGEPDRQELSHFHPVIEATLLDHAGHTVCRATGSPKNGVSGDGWVLATTRGQSAFWHRSCAEVRLKRSEEYKLTIEVRDVDTRAPKVRVTPSFERSDAYSP